VQLAAGYDAACALTASNRVKCWGNNFKGFLAVPHDEIDFAINAVEIEGIAPVVAIKAYSGGIVALRANGEVWIWGDDLTSRDKNRKPRRVPEIKNAIDIIVGSEYGCALLADHNMRCFGPRIERNIEKSPGGNQRPPFEDKQSWVDARLFEIWYDAPVDGRLIPSLDPASLGVQ